VVVMIAGSMKGAVPSLVCMTGVGAPDGHPNAGAAVTGFIQLTDDDAGAGAGPSGAGMGRPGIWSPKRDICCSPVSMAAELELANWDAEGLERRANSPPKASEVGGRVRREEALGCGSGCVLRLVA
jgi:hypothetical protein